jgi:hypothetical protein
METKDTMDLDTLNRSILGTISADIKECEDYQRAVILPTMKERYQIYYADKEYYKAMFPKLSRTSSVVSTDVTDTIEWALPSLMKVFTSGDDVVSITGHDALDSHKADAMQDLINFQLQRENHFFPILYNWMKDALITGIGLTKCYWDRKEAVKPVTCVLNWTSLQELRKTGVEITNISQPDQFGDYTVTYNSTYYLKNAPKIENILCTDVLYSPDAKSLDDANFVAHKKLVTLSYLREMEQQGIYANVDQIKGDHVHGKYGKDDIDTEMDSVIGDKYYNFPSFSPDEARDEVTIYECYVKIDINGDGILEDMIITVCQDTILRCEPNYMGRHPFFAIAPTQDPHRIWSKRSYAELIGEIQHLKVALTRQIIHNLALSNDPKVIMSPEAINIEDFNKGRSVIRKKPGYTMSDAVLPMPVTQIAPYTFNFLEYLEGQKEQRTGITRYNQGLDASSLNRTATGISAILNQSNQRLELIARMFAETGIYELYRFLISLNQKFIDQTTVVRLSGEPLEINPEDLDGKFDLVVNSGLSIQSKAAVGTQLQSLLTAIMQTNSAGVQVATPHNIYNIFKKWLETQGIKNVGDYISDPVIAQQRTMLEMQVIQTTLQTLPPDVVQYYFTYGSLPIQVLYSLPPYVQVVFLGHQLPQSGQAPQEPMGAMPQAESPQFSGTGGAVTGVVRPIVKQGSDVLSPTNQIGQQAPDNRLPAGMPTEPQQGIGGF